MTSDTSPQNADQDSLTPTLALHDSHVASATPDDERKDSGTGPSPLSRSSADRREEDHEEKQADGTEESAATRRLSHLPSPPLTRTNTRESTSSTRRQEPDADEKTGDWHPLHDDARSAVNKEASRPDLTVIVEDGEQVVDSHGRLLFPDDTSSVGAGTEKPAAGRRTSHLHLDLTRSREPQPWDLVDPPETDGKSWGATPRGFGTMRSGANTPRPQIPRSAYFTGPPPPDAAFGTAPVGQIGLHHPREIVRIERDYSGGELVQFAPIYPLELEGRITPTQFLESINAINELLILAHSTRHAFVDNTLAVLTLQLSRLFVQSYYDRMMRRLKNLIDELNVEIYNPAGLNILWPRKVAFLFLEIEYYVSLLVPLMPFTNAPLAVIMFTCYRQPSRVTSVSAATDRSFPPTRIRSLPRTYLRASWLYIYPYPHRPRMITFTLHRPAAQFIVHFSVQRRLVHPSVRRPFIVHLSHLFACTLQLVAFRCIYRISRDNARTYITLGSWCQMASSP
ncbi:Golgin subfamily A member 7/ERF4 family-domain-containing protein [Schizophyllum commune]